MKKVKTKRKNSWLKAGSNFADFFFFVSFLLWCWVKVVASSCINVHFNAVGLGKVVERLSSVFSLDSLIIFLSFLMLFALLYAYDWCICIFVMIHFPMFFECYNQWAAEKKCLSSKQNFTKNYFLLFFHYFLEYFSVFRISP